MATRTGPICTAATVKNLYSDSTQRGPIDVDTLLPPDLGDWPVSPGMAAWLSRLIGRLERRSALEFGAGWSSLIIAKSLEASGGGRLTSVEHQPEFIREDVRRGVEQANGVDASMIVTPLHLRLSTHGLLWSYRNVRRRLAERAPYDLLFIDAPPLGYGRTSPLHDAWPFLSPGAVVVLDDAARLEEQTIAKRWLATYPGLTLAVMDVTAARGIAVFVHDGGKRRRLAARAVAGSFRDRWRTFRQNRK